ncbi:phage antirepressor KilAC domain-containing protein [Metabacillus litoralis]|uniref:phage antirepressor KilAC domain-containing protein n=1 Tax=Metabacillus litoralis TaxID=152268 RepID=UPI00203EBAC4|nr:phage antirepressor KilAC domain-containing protein [Metabacillus litoralis]
MNDLITTNQNENGDIIVSGRELHEFLEVDSKYQDWFSRMCGYGFEEGLDFVSKIEPTQKKEGSRIVTRNLEDHHMKLDMAKEIAMIQRSEKGKQARQYFLHIEKMWNSPEMVMKRALEYADKKVIELKEKIALDKPKVIFAEAVEVSSSSILIGELSKLLKQNGIEIGQNRLFKWLRNKGYLIKKKGEMFNLPSQKSMDLGLFEIKKRIVSNPDGSSRTTRTPKVTGKGQIYFINKFLNEDKQLAN